MGAKVVSLARRTGKTAKRVIRRPDIAGIGLDCREAVSWSKEKLATLSSGSTSR
jgi:hypothetical protein